jgi:hypothetical protein
MEAQLYNHYPYPGEGGCSIVIGLNEQDIEELKKARDALSINMYGTPTPWVNLIKLLDNIIAETKKDDTQGIRYRDAQLRERI